MRRPAWVESLGFPALCQHTPGPCIACLGNFLGDVLAPWDNSSRPRWAATAPDVFYDKTWPGRFRKHPKHPRISAQIWAC